ncbi:phage holin family protein [Fodinibius salsisoli]|uniref:Phage holin family protein n=1 Tax=Fodinibius salsisoli TaxID=2820877 RepID=A0ABT3PMR4_9BACT|nr:phage holin family protein [Fodinibius salsisoli]MCW9707242.1 phage holin family protein [Fodinibius salsisoli]
MKSDKVTDQVGQKLRSITTDLKRYVEKRLELVMLNAGEHFSRWMAISVQRSAGALLLVGGICFLLFALAIYLGNLLGSESLGYVLVSIPLLILGGLFMSLKPQSLLHELQERFEAEVIEAVEEQERTSTEKKLKAPEFEQPFNNEV